MRRLSEELREANEELEQALVELRQSQDRIISQQKLAELGELSSGMAHEMRNPLQFVLNFTSASIDVAAELDEMLARLDAADPEEADELITDLKENLDRVLHHGGRANSTVSAMMLLDRGTGGGFRAVDLNELLTEQTNLAHQSVKAYEPGFSAEVSMELDAALEDVVAVPEDVARVIAHLVTNACQAMVERARLEGNEYRPRLTVATAAGDDEVTMRFRDNGEGMTPETMEKMFSPFFTTRTTERNTGLGLSLVHDVVRAHGGDITAESEPGDYTEITVTLPKHPDTKAAHLATPSPQSVPQSD